MYSDSVTKRLDLLIGIGTIIVVILIDPRGDFPLSDDWSYAYTVELACRENRIEYLPWMGAGLFFQALYGTALCKMFGFSFTILRLSTIVAAALGLFSFSRWLSLLEIAPVPRAMAVATLALSPMYVNLSFTFMTDVPFTVLVITALHAYTLGLRNNETRPLIVGSVLAGLAFLVRQHGLEVAVGAALAVLLAEDRPASTRAKQVAACTVLPAITCVVYLAWLFGVHGAPAGLTNKLTEATQVGLLGTVNLSFRAAMTLGFAAAPLALAVLPGILREPAKRRSFIIAMATSSFLALGLWLREGNLMFYLTNVQFDLGVGALTLRDALFLDVPPSYSVGTPLVATVMVLAMLGSGAVVTSFAAARRNPAEALTYITLLLLFFGSLLHTRYYFDRYVLPMIPLACAGLLLATRTRSDASTALVARLGWALVTATGFFAIAGTHDYMEWNRARYSMLTELEKRGVPRTEIDGGMEYNSWHLAGTLGTWPSDDEARSDPTGQRKSWWWVVDDHYIVSFTELDGYHTTRARSYPTWLTPGRGEVLLLERSPRP